MTMQYVLRNFGRNIIKNLVYSLGCPSTRNLAVEALRRSAVWAFRPAGSRSQRSASQSQGRGAQTQETGASSTKPLDLVQEMLHPKKPASDEDRERISKRWVGPNVMYLLHHTLHKYKTMNDSERRRAMRCLDELTGFLLAEDAASYVPKILSSVNIGMAEPDPETRLHAVKALRGFVKVLCEAEEPPVELVGGVMSDIVVAVFPVYGAEDESNHTAEAREEATSLIEYLVGGPLGTELKPYFRNIPFLPPNPSLDGVRSKLAENDCDFEALSGYTGDEANNQRAAEYAAIMRIRLSQLAALAGHENVRVRRAVLRHLTTLVAGHRGLFKRLVEEEGGAGSRFQLASDEGSQRSEGERNEGQVRVREFAKRTS